MEDEGKDLEYYKDRIFDIISKYLREASAGDKEYYKLLAEYSERRGSYSRPLLLALAAKEFGADEEQALLLAAVVQLSEDWILALDDMHDDAEVRRGGPTLHMKYGRNLAELAVVVESSAMWHMMHDLTTQFGKEKRDALHNELYNIGVHTGHGQYIDLTASGNVDVITSSDERKYFEIINNKTVLYSVVGPLRLAAILADKDKEFIGKIEEVGEPLGIAFQLNDDLLDMEPEEVTKKSRYSDIYESKLTLLVMRAYGLASSEEKARIVEIYRKRRSEKTKEDVEYMLTLYEKYKVREYVKDKISQQLDLAKERLGGMLGDIGPAVDVVLSKLKRS